MAAQRPRSTGRFERLTTKAPGSAGGYLQAVFGIKNAHVIHHGVDTEYFCPAPESDLRTDNRPLQLLFVGNLTRRKGADLLPSIMSALGSQFTLEYTSGLRTDDGIERVPNMRPLGRVSQTELRAAYRRADALLFPTRFEGFGLPAAEAMACGKAVVTTDCSSLPEIVQDGVTGKLCDVDDIDGYVGAVRELAEDREQLRAMGRRARARALERFTLRGMTQEYIRLFGALL